MKKNIIILILIMFIFSGCGFKSLYSINKPAFTIEAINSTELAEVNQELFDKVFGPDVVKSQEELKGKIKEDAEKQFLTQADQQLLNAVTEYLVENTKFDLPAELMSSYVH